MPSYEEQVRQQMEQAAKDQQSQPAPDCPLSDDIDAAFSIKRSLRKLGAKIGLVKHPTAQAIGDLKRGKVGDSDLSKPPKRRK